MISVVCDECHSAGWRDGECHYVECRGAALMFVELLVYVQIFTYQSWNTDPRPLQTPENLAETWQMIFPISDINLILF
jgi:hypothetical protein